MTSLGDQVRTVTTAARRPWQTKIVTGFAGALLAIESAWGVAYHAGVNLRGLLGERAMDSMRQWRYGLTHMLSNIVDSITGAMPPLIVPKWIDVIRKMVVRVVPWLAQMGEFVESVVAGFVGMFTTIHFPVIYWACLGTLVYTVVLEWRQKEDEQLRFIVEQVAASPQKARPPNDLAEPNEDPIEDAIYSAPLSPYAIISWWHSVVGPIFAGMAKVAHWLGTLRKTIRRHIPSMLYVFVGPALWLAELAIETVSWIFDMRPDLWDMASLDITIFRRRLAHPRFPEALPSALEWGPYGLHYYNIQTINLLPLAKLDERLNANQTAVEWPIIEVLPQRYAPWFFQEFMVGRYARTRRYAQRFLFFRLEETVCLDTNGPQFIVFPTINLAGEKNGDILATTWKDIRPRYARVKVRINMANETAFWVWSSPIAVAALRLQQLVVLRENATTDAQRMAAPLLTQDQADDIIVGLKQFQSDLLASRKGTLDARAVLNGVAGVVMQATLWRNREPWRVNIASLDLWVRAYDSLRVRYERYGGRKPIDLHGARTDFITVMSVREPTDLYPIQLDLHDLEVTIAETEEGTTSAVTNDTIRWILWDYMCRLADVFSWVILLQTTELARRLDPNKTRLFTPAVDWITRLADDTDASEVNGRLVFPWGINDATSENNRNLSSRMPNTRYGTKPQPS